jgi:hypothetical protein
MFVIALENRTLKIKESFLDKKKKKFILSTFRVRKAKEVFF